MKQKLLDILTKMKPYIDKAIKASPLIVGVIIGYIGHPIIQLGLDISMKIVHMVIG